MSEKNEKLTKKPKKVKCERLKPDSYTHHTFYNIPKSVSNFRVFIYSFTVRMLLFFIAHFAQFIFWMEQYIFAHTHRHRHAGICFKVECNAFQTTKRKKCSCRILFLLYFVCAVTVCGSKKQQHRSLFDRKHSSSSLSLSSFSSPPCCSCCFVAVTLSFTFRTCM